ncbi:hypothetical protein BV898_13936 [Hypsibius exemplaris]|uniref:Globin domain-containing protein n=1 Tax=Hypsibius exemplaris TaxID=2072580 RepID=A0A1W0W990_HYPEX|nr:hypothetical protein BV898_13936 [Hypsibius exemplaris]
MGAKYSRRTFEDSSEDCQRQKSILVRRFSLFTSPKSAVPPKAVPHITDEERQLLVDSFGNLKNSISQIGVLLFIGLFESHPEMQGFFGDIKDCPPHLLPQSKQLRTHALRVMGFIEKCISRIHTPERLDAIIRQLGRHHFKYGAPPGYIPLVGPQFILAIRMTLDPQWDAVTEDAWLNLFAYIAYGMKQAMASSSHPDLLTPTT